MMSRTRDCAPNETASPNTPAPAISGAVSMPRRDSTISTASTAITVPKAARSSGRMVCSREAGAAASSSSAPGSARPAADILQVPVDRQPEQLPGEIGDEQRPHRRRARLQRAGGGGRGQLDRIDPDPGQRHHRTKQDGRAQDAVKAARHQPVDPAPRAADRRLGIVPPPLGQPLEDEQQKPHPERRDDCVIVGQQAERQPEHEEHQQPGDRCKAIGSQARARPARSAAIDAAAVAAADQAPPPRRAHGTRSACKGRTPQQPRSVR